MKTTQLTAEILRKKSFLCVGLDVDMDKVPSAFRNSPTALVDFSKAIIDATVDYAVAYKPNIAFFETYGVEGVAALKEVIDYLNAKHPEVFTIADAKRGDIGNTSTRYAKAYFETLGFDSITVAPYMGKDSVEPFLAFEDKHTILLALTSNPGSNDFQRLETNGKPLFQSVLETAKTWEGSDQLMYVVGATRADALTDIRKIVPDAFLLVPGVGAQGGSLAEVATYGLNKEVGLLVNSSRGIIYASQEEDFANAARRAAKAMQEEMALLLAQNNLI
ncbi:orotidine-5'-phosphate decarboxylase [Flavobacteriaceae bacterium]|nr:orotidine-5'-phosphate decarboxylase [Flavobacteriaceae bacterium]MDA9244946.1 orotidine-5'-phosphate decarboxylase [Flavobacteriaceae bacterium]MDA9886668.1 orotidine-5'-phosphate decarboxylase [Flavobacteriaceae bacterium]MDA9984272.1 orotidine-5'-phosphate decarboxylase [Flavobacteriaceae bacterium]MDB4118075.1 orotidine-5'-phosphate decarboxylase [Flavobacteriaceae bacterium]